CARIEDDPAWFAYW
nr:immunoglobulin heavy chain junction region [Mus musculus]MBK4195236.1 immunoglobulin heavy chain junction region [Mus musculus]MBK4195237.1 immunoglobulin heavy chain junction region [Mus musculus]